MILIRLQMIWTACPTCITIFQHEYLYWEFPGYGGQQAVRSGDWKAVRQRMLRRDNRDPLRIELYHLKDDVGESRDVAAAHPEIVARLRSVMEAEHVPSKLFPMPPIDTREQATTSTQPLQRSTP